MKHLVGVHKGSYIFDASEKTVELVGFAPLTLDQILTITNVTDNAIIYLFSTPGKGASISSNILTLDLDTTSMDDSDILQIFVEIDEAIPVIQKDSVGAVISPALESKQDTAITILNTLSTEAKLESVRVLLASLDSKDFSTQTTLNALLVELKLKADLSETQPVSAASLPLPAGASTEAKQDIGNTSTGNIDTKTGEVSASPTSNTILGRLKDIWDRLISGIVIRGGTSGNLLEVNSDNEAKVILEGVVDDNNSSVAILGIGGIFTGVATRIVNYGFVFVSVYSDVASGTEGLSIEQSSDGTNWDSKDTYSIPAATGKLYAPQPALTWFRVVYTNGSVGQVEFRLSTILKKTSSLATSHKLNSALSEEDDSSVTKSILAFHNANDGIYENVGIQHPFPIDGDSVYSKDIWLAESNMNDFSGSLTDLFDSLHSIIVDNTANDPKEIFVHFNRTVVTNTLGLGAHTGDFSNVKIIGVLSGNVEATLFDDSGDNTKLTTATFSLPVTAGLNAIRIQFHTADTVTISNLVIFKTRSVVSRLQGVRPNGTVADLNATVGGNFKVALEELENNISVNNNTQLRTTIYDKAGIPQGNNPLTAFGDLRTSELSPIIQSTFEFTVDNTDLTTNSIVIGGTVTQDSAMAVLTTSTTTGSKAKLLSKQHARYHSGLGGLSRFTALFTTPVAATEQLIGLADEAGSSEAFMNGFMVGYVGTVFGFHRFQNDVLTTIPIASWDDPLDGFGRSGMTLDQMKLNVYFIQFQFLGAGAIKIFIENDSDGGMILVHTVLYANLNIVPSVFNPNFFHTMWVNNKATTSNLILKSSSFAFFVEGKTEFIELHRPEFSTGIRQKLTVTTEVAIFTIRNKSTYASKTNFIDILILNISSSIEATAANNLGSVRLVKNATIGGTPVYNDINATNSVVEIDVAGTTVTGGNELAASPLAGKNDKESRNITNMKIILNPGETITLAGLSVSSATIEGVTLWRELF